jgi:hypothetical protein
MHSSINYSALVVVIVEPAIKELHPRSFLSVLLLSPSCSPSVLAIPMLSNRAYKKLSDPPIFSFLCNSSGGSGRSSISSSSIIVYAFKWGSMFKCR